MHKLSMCATVYLNCIPLTHQFCSLKRLITPTSKDRRNSFLRFYKFNFWDFIRFFMIFFWENYNGSKRNFYGTKRYKTRPFFWYFLRLNWTVLKKRQVGSPVLKSKYLKNRNGSKRNIRVQNGSKRVQNVCEISSRPE